MEGSPGSGGGLLALPVPAPLHPKGKLCFRAAEARGSIKFWPSRRSAHPALQAPQTPSEESGRLGSHVLPNVALAGALAADAHLGTSAANRCPSSAFSSPWRGKNTLFSSNRCFFFSLPIDFYCSYEHGAGNAQEVQPHPSVWALQKAAGSQKRIFFHRLCPLLLPRVWVLAGEAAELPRAPHKLFSLTAQQRGEPEL